MASTSYEYAFVRLGEGRFTVRKAAARTYQQVVHERARDGWRLVQIFAPNLNFASAAFYELIFERERPPAAPTDAPGPGPAAGAAG